MNSSQDKNTTRELESMSPRSHLFGIFGLDSVGSSSARESLEIDGINLLDLVGDFDPDNELLPIELKPNQAKATATATVFQPETESFANDATINEDAGSLIRRQQLTRSKKRKYRKEEIEELRETVKLLSEQLNSLRTARSSSGLPAQHSDSIQQALWQRIATRQLQRRLKAEKEALTLQKLKVIQRSEIKNFKRLFKRRIDEELMGKALLLRRPKHIQDRVNNTQMFSELLNDCDELDTGFDAGFQIKDVSNDKSPGRTCQVHRHVDSGVFVEFLDHHVVPFSVQQAVKAIWQCLGRRKIPVADHIYAEEYDQNVNTTTTYVNFLCTLGGTAVYVQEHGAVRKSLEEHRALFVSQTISEVAGNTADFYRGLKYRETKRVVVKRGLPLASGQETAIIETHLAVSRTDDASRDAMAFRKQNLVDLAVKGWDYKISRQQQEIENLLFVSL